ncbi:UNVERIFIED_CONTAM: hypothetical protein FKN15_050346 [Acipenser sinensis]
MASVAVTEPSLSPVSEALVPACMFAPERGCGDDPAGSEHCDDGEALNGKLGDHVDFTSKRGCRRLSGHSLINAVSVSQRGCRRLSDGGDYGLDEVDMQASVATVLSLSEQIGADMVLLRDRPEAGGRVRDYLIRRRVGEADFLEVRVAVVGNVDAGKSTLLGVLTHGELDNGRGFARQKLFRHKHEMESGRTSSVGNDILGFDQRGAVVNLPDGHGGSLDWTKICERSAKVITFIDLAGHEKYLKTTVFGMTGHLPDFCMLMGERVHSVSDSL